MTEEFENPIGTSQVDVPGTGDPASDSVDLGAVTESPGRTSEPVRFGAGKAFAAFCLLVIAQALSGMVVMVAAIAVAVVRGVDPNGPEFTKQLIDGLTVPILVAGGLISTLVAYWLARRWAWHLVLDKTENGLGVRRASRGQIGVSLSVGASLAVVYMFAPWLVPMDPSAAIGPVASAAMAGGASRLVWALLALIFAPLVEEFFFRGLLLRGFTTSWGGVAGGLAVTVLFVSLHLFETVVYWPATVAVIVLSLATLGARVLTGSLAAAAAVHAAYNAVIVIVAYASPAHR